MIYNIRKCILTFCICAIYAIANSQLPFSKYTNFNSNQSQITVSIYPKDASICPGNSIMLHADTAIVHECGDLSDDLGNGLIGYYPFCGNANDLVNGNNGTVINATFSNDRYNNINSSYHFNGNNSFIRTNSILPVTNNFTMAVWVKPEAIDVIQAEGITGQEGSAKKCVIHPTHGSNWGNVGQNCGVGLYMGTNVIHVTEHSDLWITNPIVYQGNFSGWTLVVITYTDHIPRLYVNGILVKTGQASGHQYAHPSNGNDFTTYSNYSNAGFGNGFTNQWFLGIIDEILIYDRPLTSEEVSKLYYQQAKLLWSTGDTTSSITVSPLQTTTYYVTATYAGVSAIDSAKVTVAQARQSVRYPNVNTFINYPTNLRARDFGIVYSWIPPAGLNDPSINNPVATLNDDQQYLINITDSANCTVADTLQVNVFKEANIYVPTGFTPNGDGRNDELYPILIGIKQLNYFRIYNRWGNLVFQTKEPNKGWDGAYKATKQPNAVFAWMVEGETYDGKIIMKKGTVTLIH